MNNSLILAGSQIINRGEKHLTNTDGLHLYFLYFKKICYHLLSKSQDSLIHITNDTVDLISLYEFISYIDIDLSYESSGPIEKLFQSHLHFFGKDEVSLINDLKAKNFNVTIKFYKDNIKLIKDITKKAILIFLKRFDSF